MAKFSKYYDTNPVTNADPDDLLLIDTSPITSTSTGAIKVSDLISSAPLSSIPESSVINLVSDLSSKYSPSNPPPTGSGDLLAANNLSDVANAATAFGNIKQNATSGATGVVQLAGDLGGTATAPTVKKSATIYIASTSSGYLADFYTSGTADQNTINSAISALPSGGGEIILRAGTYIITNSINANKANVTFSGEGTSTYIVNDPTANGNIFSVTADDVTIRYMKLDGNSANVTTDHHGISVGGSDASPVAASRTKLIGLYITNTVHHGIQSPHCIDMLIDGCYVSNPGKASNPEADGVGIIIGNTAVNAKVTNCTVYNTAFHGIQVYAHSRKVFISNCHVLQVGQTSGGSAGNGIEVHPDNQDVHISNCWLSVGSTGGNGITIESSDATGKTAGVLVENTTIDSFDNLGIRIDAASDISIKGCNIRNNGQNPNSPSNNAGIKIFNDTTLYQATGIVIDGNNIFDNQVSPTQAQPIVIYNNSTDITIGVNNFYGNVTGNAVYVDPTATGKVNQLPGVGVLTLALGRANSGAGNPLTITAGGAQVGGTNLGGGDLILQSGVSTGSTRAKIQFAPTIQTGSGTSDALPSTQAVLFATATSRGTLSLGNTTGSPTGLPVGANVNSFALTGEFGGGLAMYRRTNSNTAGNDLSIFSAGATVGATDKASGNLVLSTGTATGVGGGSIILQTTTPGSGGSSTTDNTFSTRMTISSSGVDVASNKITSLANGSASTDAAAFGQIPTSATTIGGLLASNNLSDVASASTARTNLGLGSLATQSGTFSGTSSGTNTGDQTNISGNAATVTTNANLTGPITSVGNATSVGAQTGTGSTFVMNTSPTLVTPNIGAATGSSLNLGTGSLNTVGNIEIDGTAARDMTVGRATTGTGSVLTIQAGGAQSGGTNLQGGTLILSSGITVGNVRSYIGLAIASQGASGTSDTLPTVQATFFASTTNQPVLALGISTASPTGLPTGNTANSYVLTGQATGGLAMYRHTTSNTAGNTLTIQPGGATSGATNKAGGTLSLLGGLSTGSGNSQITLGVYGNSAGSTSDNTSTTMLTIGQSAITAAEKVILNAATTAASSLNIPSGTAPTSPNSGDMYFDGTNLFFNGGGLKTVNGSLTLGTAGNKINITTGSNASAGTGTLVGGTATISTTAVTANSLIFLQDTSTSVVNVGVLTVSAKTAGTSFVVTSTVAIDTSTFNWWIVN